jgi:quinolinate synthase
MARIDHQHLAWCIENIINNEPVNIIKVPEGEAKLAKLTLDRMLQVS